jgi:hypothetical protein
MPKADGHYVQFSEIYGKSTEEKHRPSLTEKKGVLTEKQAGFRVSGETVRLILECEECQKPRFLNIFGLPF